MRLTRRRLLATTAGVAGAGSLAGCIGERVDAADSGSGGTTAQSSFFVFGDITGEVAGDAATAALLVPIGQHGHGWEPGPRVREEIGDADLLVHGMEGFQPWLDTIRTDLEADGSDVVTVDVSADVNLLAPGSEHDHEDDGEDDGHEDEKHHEETEHTEEHDEEHHDEDEHEGEGEDDHDHEGMDPHFWMDPLRVKQAVGTVEGALSDLDDENASTYAENAEAFRGRLDGLHERIESTVAEATTGTILVAGHDSFQYFGERYDVDIRALTNVSPDDQPTPRDIERAQEVVEHHGLRYICADPLESQRAAEQLVAETDAEAVLPLTAMPGLTEAWGESDWGYVEVMENVNLPTLERALGV